ncbi:DMR6-like oxygenase 2-like protein [Tanacetum coccineum]
MYTPKNICINKHPDSSNVVYGSSEMASSMSKRTQVIVNELLKGVSENFGFKSSYLNKELNFDSSFRLLAVNYCPFLPDFDLARGLMPHTDHGVLTLLYENDVSGLEVFHNGKWVVMSGVPNAFLVLMRNHLEEPNSPEAAPASPDYVPGPEEPEQASLSPDYVPGPEYPKYLAPSDEEVPVKDQPYAVADSPIALSLGYVADSDPEEDPEEDSEDGPVDYPADGGDGDDDDSSDDDEEEEEASEEEELRREERG